MNMYYNDSHDTAEMVGRGEDPEFYFSLAKDFINDIDGKDFKVENILLRNWQPSGNFLATFYFKP